MNDTGIERERWRESGREKEGRKMYSFKTNLSQNEIFGKAGIQFTPRLFI